jgi:DNA helicase HerA-like ATPase
VSTLAPADTAELRRELREASQVMPLGWSAGARRFSFQAPLTLRLAGGGYVLLTTEEGTRYLGQVLDRVVTERTGPSWTLEMESATASGAGRVREARVEVPIRLVEGSGELLARFDGEELVAVSADDSFREADLATAPADLVTAFVDQVDAGATLLDIGEAASGGRARLHAQGFARHTFLCGQSGAGKTYALGVVLERLIMETELRLVVLDPNGDYVGLGSVARGVRVFSRDHEPLRLRFGELAPATRAAVVGLDPLRDREEYGAFDRLAEGGASLAEVRDAAVAEGSPEARQIALRIDNLGVDTWDLWAGEGEASVLDAVMGDAQATVIDLSSLDAQEEQALSAGAVLAHLWARRAERRPALVVIDEAHNVCPAGQPARLGSEGRDLVVRIAGEGRKYGLYLLLVTQRPEKLEPNALTQSDNLILLRLNSAADVERIASAFSFVSPSLLAEAPSFAKGEALLAGGIVGRPTRARVGGRLSPEGGGDVPTTWARPR